MSVRGTIGKIGLIPEEFIGGNITANLIRISPNRVRVNERYLWRYMRSTEFVNSLDSASSSTTIKTIKAPDLKNILIPLPPIEEQKRIAEILDRTQSLISKRKEAIAKLETLTQSIFIEMFGDPVTNPKKWKMLPLAELCSIVGEYGAGLSSKEYNSNLPRYIRITDITKNGELSPELVSPTGDIKDWKNYKLNAGDILFARSGATVGKTYIHRESKENCIFAGYLIRFHPKEELLLPEFLFRYTHTSFYHAWVLARQRVVAQPNINAKQYGYDLQVPVPPLPLQKEFAQRVEAIEKLKATHHTSLTELQALFASLQHRAFRGEL